MERKRGFGGGGAEGGGVRGGSEGQERIMKQMSDMKEKPFTLSSNI
jgi:hypothetical protein